MRDVPLHAAGWVCLHGGGTNRVRVVDVGVRPAHIQPLPRNLRPVDVPARPVLARPLRESSRPLAENVYRIGQRERVRALVILHPLPQRIIHRVLPLPSRDRILNPPLGVILVSKILVAGGAYVPQFGMYAIRELGPWAAVKRHSENKISSLTTGSLPADPPVSVEPDHCE